MKLVLPFLLLMSACTAPRAGVGIGIGPNGVSVNPVISGNVGGVGVSVSPSIN